MKRPILTLLIGYLLGIIWELYFEKSIALFIVVIIVCFLISKMKLIVYKFGYKSLNPENLVILIVGMLVSNSIMTFVNNKYECLYNGIGENTYIATIISDGDVGDYKTTYVVNIESIDGSIKYENTRLILSISNKYNIYLEYGDRISFNGTYTEPEVQRNYNGFDYSLYLKTQKIYGTVTYSGGGISIINRENLNCLRILAYNISINIEKNIHKMFGTDDADFLIGILLGKSENIGEEVKENFRNSGLYHILAVSGTHMSYVVLGITYLLNKVNISKNKKNILKIFGIIFFMLITSFSVSIIRAGIMGIVLICADLFYRKNDMINSICVSMLIILIYNPYSICSLGFQLSYGGVIGIVCLNNFYINLLTKLKIKEGLVRMMSVVLSAQTMITPIVILNFHTFSFSFLFSNIIASFFAGGVIILGFLIILISFVSLKITSLFVLIEKILIKGLIITAEICGSLPFSKIYVTSPSGLSIILYYLILFVLYVETEKNIEDDETQGKITHKVCFKNILIVLLIATLAFNHFSFPTENLRIYFIDVGQGDSTLIITPYNKKILIDGGGSESGDYDVGEEVLLPYLLSRGIKKLDYVMVSHFDTDHVRRNYDSY